MIVNNLLMLMSAGGGHEGADESVVAASRCTDDPLFHFDWRTAEGEPAQAPIMPVFGL